MAGLRPRGSRSPAHAMAGSVPRRERTNALTCNVLI